MKQYTLDLLQNNPGSGVGRSNWQYTSNENVHEFNHYWICVMSKWWFPRLYSSFLYCLKSPQWLRGKVSACKAGGAGDTGSIPGFGRSPGGGNGKPFQYPCLKKSHGQRNLEGYSPWGCRVRQWLSDWAIKKSKFFTLN